MQHATCGSGAPKGWIRLMALVLGMWGALALGATGQERLTPEISQWALDQHQDLIAEVPTPSHLCTKLHKVLVMRLGPDNVYVQPIMTTGGDGCHFQTKHYVKVPIEDLDGLQVTANEGNLTFVKGRTTAAIFPKG